MVTSACESATAAELLTGTVPTREDARTLRDDIKRRIIDGVPLFGLALDAAKAWLAQLSTYASKNPLGLKFPTERGALRSRPPRSWPTIG